MELFVIRHGLAEEGRPGLADARRALTPEGRKKLEGVVAGLDRLGLRFDRLLHSPRLRAVETAELLRPCLEGESVVAPGLARSPAAPLLEELRGERVAVVGHEPWLSELCAWLCLGDAALGERLVLKKGGLAWLEGEPRPGGMRLVAWIPPKVLRGL